MRSRRVVITGLGAVSPGGLSADETWEAVVGGRSAVSELRRFPPMAGTKAAAAVPDVADWRTDSPLAIEFGLKALEEALDDAGLALGDEVDLAVVAHHGERLLRPPDTPDDTPRIQDAVRDLGAAAGAKQSAGIYGACAGGGLAIGTAYELLKAGRADIAVAGGTDCLLREVDYAQFVALYAMSTRECPPQEACCPFDRRRDGFVMAEGAAFVVLESEEHSEARGARPRAVMEGYGCSQNAYHLIASPPDATGPALSMSAALADAHASPESVDYINAHGTSTRDNDWCETRAIRKVFGEAAAQVPVSSSKSVLGHMMAAAGAVEAVLCVKALEAARIPPTINLIEPDPACDLDYVPWTAVDADLRRVVSNSFGFGGHNTSLVFGKA